jgi:hypothetical protein
MLKIISSKDKSIWNVKIEIMDNTFRFVVNNEFDSQIYESEMLHFQQLDFMENLTNVFDFNLQQKIVNRILEENPNFIIYHTWMKKNSIYKTDQNEILAYYMKDDEYQYALYIELKRLEKI